MCEGSSAGRPGDVRTRDRACASAGTTTDTFCVRRTRRSRRRPARSGRGVSQSAFARGRGSAPTPSTRGPACAPGTCDVRGDGGAVGRVAGGLRCRGRPGPHAAGSSAGRRAHPLVALRCEAIAPGQVKACSDTTAVPATHIRDPRSGVALGSAPGGVRGVLLEVPEESVNAGRGDAATHLFSSWCRPRAPRRRCTCLRIRRSRNWPGPTEPHHRR